MYPDHTYFAILSGPFLDLYEHKKMRRRKKKKKTSPISVTHILTGAR